MEDQTHEEGTSRRHLLECMAWAGTGLLWTFAGGVPHATRLFGSAAAATADATQPFSFVQISDSHIGFNKAANPHAIDTLQEAIDHIVSLPTKPAFLIHTGDITHLSRASEFDTAAQIIGRTRLDVHYVPGEHDLIDADNGKLYAERHGAGTIGAGWYSFDHAGVHFVGLVNVVELHAGGLGHLGSDQLTWLARDLDGRPASTPIVVFAHIPLWTVYPDWGWGTEDGAQALALLRRFGSVTVLNGHIHQIIRKVEGHMTFHTARSTAFPQPEPGRASSPGPMTVPTDRLRHMLGLTTVAVAFNEGPLAIADQALADWKADR
jgi:hypothetical protein